MAADRGDLFDPRVRTWWKVTIVCYLATTLGLLGYWTVTGTGLFRVFDELIAQDSGDVRVHYPTVAFVISLLLMMIPFVTLRIALGRRVRNPDPDDVLRF